MNWKGCIVEESLTDNRVLNDLKIEKVRITKEEDSNARWHIYNTIVTEDQIKLLHKKLKDKWYMHFWKEDEMTVLFQDKKFVLDINDKESWKNAVDYGLSLGIPKEQLDFEIEF